MRFLNIFLHISWAVIWGSPFGVPTTLTHLTYPLYRRYQSLKPLFTAFSCHFMAFLTHFTSLRPIFLRAGPKMWLSSQSCPVSSAGIPPQVTSMQLSAERGLLFLHQIHPQCLGLHGGKSSTDVSLNRPTKLSYFTALKVPCGVMFTFNAFPKMHFQYPWSPRSLLNEFLSS